MSKIYFLFLFIQISISFLSFAVDYNPESKFCFREWFPQQESIAVQYRIIVPNRKQKKMDIILDKNNPLYKNISLEYWTTDHMLLGKSVNHNEVWTHVTTDPQVLEFCVQNSGKERIILEFNITMNIYNNDHSRVANKDHLTEYEQDIIELEKITEELREQNFSVSKKVLQRRFDTGDLNTLITKVAGVGVVFIFIVKVLEILFLRKKLRDKKML